MVEPSFLFPAISPDHQPLLRSEISACLASSSDSANSMTCLPSISDASSPPHISRAALFTYITLPSRSPMAMPLMEEAMALSLIFICSSILVLIAKPLSLMDSDALSAISFFFFRGAMQNSPCVIIFTRLNTYRHFPVDIFNSLAQVKRKYTIYTTA